VLLSLNRQQAKLPNKQHNKALHPTAESLRFGRSSLRSGFRRRVSLVVGLLPVAKVESE